MDNRTLLNNLGAAIAERKTALTEEWEKQEEWSAEQETMMRTLNDFINEQIEMLNSSIPGFLANTSSSPLNRISISMPQNEDGADFLYMWISDTGYYTISWSDETDSEIFNNTDIRHGSGWKEMSSLEETTEIINTIFINLTDTDDFEKCLKNKTAKDKIEEEQQQQEATFADARQYLADTNPDKYGHFKIG